MPRAQTPKPKRNELSPSIDDAEVRREFYASLRKTGEILQSCRELNIPYCDVINRRQKFEDFRKVTDFAIAEGKAVVHLGIAENLRRLATGGAAEDRDAIKAAEVVYRRDQVGGYGKTVLEHTGTVAFTPQLFAGKRDGLGE